MNPRKLKGNKQTNKLFLLFIYYCYFYFIVDCMFCSLREINDLIFKKNT